MKNKPYKILIVDDEENLNQLIATNLMLEGYEVESAYRGSCALQLMPIFEPDLVLLDVMMPDLDGFEVLRQIRMTSTVSVIMLTARARTEEKVKGLQLGADDYIAKPFSFAELQARVEAVLRRSSSTESHVFSVQPLLSSSHIKCQLAEHRVTVCDEEISLQKLEFKLLAEFLRAPNRVLTHDYLLSTVWPEGEGDVTTLRVAIGKLRNKLKTHSECEYIETVHGLGYRFTDQ